MKTHGIHEILTENKLFSGMDKSLLELVAGCGKNTRFSAGEFLGREGEQADVFYAIRHGTVAIEVHAPSRAPLIVQTVHEGDILGWSWLFPPHHWAFDARALAPVRAVTFDGACLREKCEKNPSVGFDLMRRFARILSKRLEATRLQLLDVYSHGTES